MSNITTSTKPDGSLTIRDIHSLCVVECDKDRTRASMKVTLHPPTTMSIDAAKEFVEVMGDVLKEAEQGAK